MPIMQKIHCPKEYLEVNNIVTEYSREGAVLVSLEEAVSEEVARKIKDYLLGFTFAKNGFAFQYQKMFLYSFLKGPTLKDCVRMRVVSENALQKRVRGVKLS